MSCKTKAYFLYKYIVFFGGKREGAAHNCTQYFMMTEYFMLPVVQTAVKEEGCWKKAQSDEPAAKWRRMMRRSFRAPIGGIWTDFVPTMDHCNFPSLAPPLPHTALWLYQLIWSESDRLKNAVGISSCLSWRTLISGWTSDAAHWLVTDESRLQWWAWDDCDWIV